jgi:hypothetical protein
MPIIAQTYIEQFIKLIEFDILNPEGIIKLFDEKFSFQAFVTGSDDPDSKPNVVAELIIYISAASAVLLAIIFFILLKFIKKINKVVNKLWEKLKKMIFWNIII